MIDDDEATTPTQLAIRGAIERGCDLSELSTELVIALHAISRRDDPGAAVAVLLAFAGRAERIASQLTGAAEDLRRLM